MSRTVKRNSREKVMNKTILEPNVEHTPSDLELLRQGKIRAVGKVRARKLRKKGIACWWSPQLHSLVWAFSLNKGEHDESQRA